MSTTPPDADLRRAFAFLAPYWHRLSLVMGISLVSTGLSLVSPYLSKDLVDQALIGRDMTALWRIVGLFALIGLLSYGLNVVSGLRYTRVSAAILFDMRLAVYAHLQRLSPRFYARTRMGDIVSRLNSDIGEIQRVAAEAALAWVGNVLFLAGSVVMLVWLDWKLALLSAGVMPLSLWALVRYRARLESRVADLRQRSADIGSFLIETLQASTLIVTSNAQERERGRFARLNDRFVAALMAMQQLSYLAGGLPGLIVSLGASVVFLYGGARVVEGTLTLGTFAAFIAYQSRVNAPVQALMGLYTSLATAKVSWRRVLELLDAPVEVREAPAPIALDQVRGAIDFEGVSLGTERGLAVLEDFTLTRRARDVGGHRRRQRQRQVDAGLPAAAAARSRRRHRPARRPRPAHRAPGRPAPPRRVRGAGADAAPRHHGREHPLRAARGHRRGGGRRRRGRGPGLVHRPAAAGLCHDGRRARLADVGR